MRGADLEPSHALLAHLVRRLAVLVRELAVAGEADSNGLLWALSADRASLVPVLEVLADREAFSRQRHAGG